MILNSITHVITIDPENIQKRKIISVHGMSFYQSTGINSTFENTWFPFFGIQEIDTAIYKKGQFLKPFLPISDMTLLKALVKYFPNNPYDNALLHLRFGTHAGILISSWLGGGLWETSQGKLLKQNITELFPDFYEHWPKPQIKDTEHMFETMQPLNAWLCQQAGVNNRFELEPKMLKLESLIALYKPKPPVLNISKLSHKRQFGSVIGADGYRRSARFMRKS